MGIGLRLNKDGNKMATKKKSSKKRSYSKPRKAKRSRRAKPWQVAAAAGAGLTAVNLLTARRGGNNSPVDIMRQSQYSIQARMKGAVDSMAANAMHLENWYPAVGGAVISAATRIPVVKIAAKPVSNVISKASGKKAVL